MTYTDRERISHVARRLGFGVEPEIARSATVDQALSSVLDLSGTTPPAEAAPPVDREDARSREQRVAPYEYWFTQMISGPRRVEERLCWFWHDHFATSIRKVVVPYLMFKQHITIRQHATGSFADLLHAIATDPAMLVYLDGVENQIGSINENFGREVMELFTLGRGNYTEDDVIASSRAFSGWVVPRGDRAARFGLEPFSAFFVPRRHDAGSKTLLGTTAALDARGAVDVLLEQPATAALIASKMYAELVGIPASEKTLLNLAAVFRADYSIMALVEEIASSPEFASDEAIRVKVRTPIERAVGLAQALDGPSRGIANGLRNVGYVPFNPPHVGGYPKGTRLLGPYHLVHGFDLASVLPRSMPLMSSVELAEALGIYDLTPQTKSVLDGATDPYLRTALAINSPEYFVT